MILFATNERGKKRQERENKRNKEIKKLRTNHGHRPPISLCPPDSSTRLSRRRTPPHHAFTALEAVAYGEPGTGKGSMLKVMTVR